MEENETMMSKEELRQLIRAKVKNNGLLPPDVLQKRFQLQSLLERRQRMDANLLKVQESVASCEAIVRKQYSLLGWEYRDTDSDDDESSGGGNGHIPPSPCESVQSGTQACLSPAVTGHTPLLPERRGSKIPQRSRKHFRMKEPVVVLTRLPESQIRDLRPPTPPMSPSNNESLSDSGSDDQWEPERESSDSHSDDCWEPGRESSDSESESYNSGSKKRRKIDQVSETKQVTTHERDQADTKADADSDAAKTLKPQAKEQKNKEHEQVEKNPPKESSPPANTKGGSSVCLVTAFCQSSDDATKNPPPSVPKTEPKVNMKVLARRRSMIWQPGKIAEILTKEDGRCKYKVSFVEKGKSLVSAHHIALEQVPSIEQLFVGARVVIKCKSDKNSYLPGVLSELPGRKNKMRFLVFIDDHTPIYVPLHGISLVCQPLSQPLDDIPDEAHKKFMEGYLKSWPNPMMTHFPQGAIIEAERNGVQKKGEVVTVDSSLIQVLFKDDQHKDWIYRGSMRLKHMINMRKQLELDKVKSKQSTSSDHK